MDDRHFDALTKSLATFRSRRAVLSGLVGLGASALAGGVLPRKDAAAARRSSPTPTPSACPGNQIFVDGKCVCADASDVKCGPDCCPPDVSVCCDNACCSGACYGEELCCPAGQVEFDGACCQPKTCPTTIPDSLLNCDTAIDDGCGGTFACGCPSGWQCTSDSGGGYCLNTTTTCRQGLSACGSNAQLAQCFGGGGYACTPDIDGTNTCATHELGFCGGTCTSDAECGSGYVCAQACDQFCDNYGCLQLPPS